MEFSIKLHRILSRWSFVYILGAAGVTDYNFPKKIVFLSLTIDFVSTSSADPDEQLPVLGFPVFKWLSLSKDSTIISLT